MSDMTSDMMDTPQAPAASRETARRKNGVEFTVYFTIIFLATLPLAPLTWAMQARVFMPSSTGRKSWTSCWTRPPPETELGEETTML